MTTVKYLNGESLLIEDDHQIIQITNNGLSKFKRNHPQAQERHKIKSEVYIVLSSGLIGRVSEICRGGETEVFIDDLRGNYLDCIKYHDLFDRNVVLNIVKKLGDLTISRANEEMNKVVADLYQEGLFETSDSD